ncbi:MAG: hypothetical protein HY897_00085 [Deltaproteobacteria bacterium]|nr:hypothetical protein [Deltaproteobacteria bacterium]
MPVVFALLSFGTGCWEAEQPAHVEVITLEGAAYERGYAHGHAFGNKIRSLYTSLLDSSILPFLNREQTDIAEVLTTYQDPAYGGGQFSYRLMLESGQNLANFIPQEYLDEMHGIADGAGLPFEKVLVLNTFLDTMLGFRSMTFFIRQLQSPFIRSVQFSGTEADGADNDGDGETDEAREGKIDLYEPKSHAHMTEVPSDTTVTLVLGDRALNAEPEGVDPVSIRIQLDKKQYVAGDPAIKTIEKVDPGGGERTLEVTFRPTGGFSAASVHSMIIQAGDLAVVTEPPPAHARLMRDERIVFTTRGFGKKPYEVENRGERDGRTQPPSIAFAVRGTATPGGEPILAHHFGLLDSNTSHKHTVLFVHKPNGRTAHAVLGWTGVIWGFSGMNADGLAYAVNSSDTLDNPMVAQVAEKFLEAKLLSSGIPIGMIGREVLAGQKNVGDAAAYVASAPRTFGWNVMLADASGGVASVETDSDVFAADDGGAYVTTLDGSLPGNLDEHGRRWASVGPDDIRMASHYRRNTEDIDRRVLVYAVRPQRFWTSFYFRSMRAFEVLGEQIESRYGAIDYMAAIDILRTPDLVDTRDSMNAVVFRPAAGIFHYAMGEVPATSLPFVEFDLRAAAGGAR